MFLSDINLGLGVLKVQIHTKLFFALALAPPLDQPTNITALKKINNNTSFSKPQENFKIHHF